MLSCHCVGHNIFETYSHVKYLFDFGTLCYDYEYDD